VDEFFDSPQPDEYDYYESSWFPLAEDIAEETVDAATAVLLLTPSSIENAQFADADTAILRFTINYLDSITHACFAGEGYADINWIGIPDYRWDAEADTRWVAVVHMGAGIC
jgi:hypothetical protein